METETTSTPAAPARGGALELFRRLEERVRNLSRCYREALQERDGLQLQNREQEQRIAELEARLRNQEEILAQVDERIESLLQQIDECLPQEGGRETSGNNQVLPGMNDG